MHVTPYEFSVTAYEDKLTKCIECGHLQSIPHKALTKAAFHTNTAAYEKSEGAYYDCVEEVASNTSHLMARLLFCEMDRVEDLDLQQM